MLGWIIKKVIGTKNDREVKRLRPFVARINEIEQSLQSLSDEALREKTAAWKAELAQIQDNTELQRRLDELLPDAFAVVKNACRRMAGRKEKIVVRGHEIAWDMIPFDVQLIGGWALHKGRIAEMATGEGKTLVATMPVYLNALSGRGVHVVTVNDYLAARDSEWMGAVYRFLGLTVGCILHDQPPPLRREQYHCDITYGTNAEFGFDYLRDNGMAVRAEEQVQRGHYFAIVDEVDSILIDEARTPLIISGPAVVNTDNSLYVDFKPRIASLVQVQEKLCRRFLSEARQLIKQLHPEDGSNPPNGESLEREIGLLLYRVKMGSPRMPEFLQLMEDPENQGLTQAAELELHADQTKKSLYAEKEELFFAIDEKGHESDLTEKGRNFLQPDDPDAFVMPDLITAIHEIDNGPEPDVVKRMEMKQKVQANFEAKAKRIHAISQLLKAFCVFQRDVQYVVQNGKVVIVDENTGRLMSGRRWSDGLHQAVEAKEGVEIERETQTLATITIQNYFRLYAKLAGMTGTAETEAAEFSDIYKLGVLVIPTNKPCVRTDSNDTVYKTRREKYNAVVQEIQEIHAQGRPILVGTISVEVSEHLSRLLKKVGIVHSVLNAKYHEQEAEIVARAGHRGGVTIATNMAGRGTDIKLGEGVAGIGGLHVLGTERHEARRIDRQLRGRCARQGDPGSSHFFISLEDDLMRLFGSDRIVKIMERVGLEEGQELEHPFLNRSIGQAQKRVEQHNFQIRKRTLEYDDVMNRQREIVYGFRNEIIHAEDVRDRLMDIIEEVVVEKVRQTTSPTADPTEWDKRPLADWINLNFPLGMPESELTKAANEGGAEPVVGSLFEGLSAAQFALARFVIERITQAYQLKVQFENPDALRTVERYTILSAIDRLWQEHLYSIDSLRYSIGLRAHGQRDPLIEYKIEAFKLFDDLMINIKSEICHNVFRSASSMMAFENFLRNLPKQTVHGQVQALGQPSAPAPDPKARKAASDMVSEATEAVSKARPIRTAEKVGRNDPCPCGSGKKYKQCCGR
ncbi:MAG: preprotein translocase subunit SecA [Verrucomicrobiales bacterium]|nr:preprotein translocase subunit SecA [Verrucomicrobiales bacterium]MCP5519873.1 preprotein translocase subunit SecA [Verrucomicrobiales bacterium]MCP5526811.1 preprotein translocase subunit SecA [Verrucomicrobiales bacterium]